MKKHTIRLLINRFMIFMMVFLIGGTLAGFIFIRNYPLYNVLMIPVYISIYKLYRKESADLLQKISRNSQSAPSLSPDSSRKEYRPDREENMKTKAHNLIHSGRYDDALNIYAHIMGGTKVIDPEIYEGVFCAFFFKEDYLSAEKAFRELKSFPHRTPSPVLDLLYARTLEKIGKAGDPLH